MMQEPLLRRMAGLVLRGAIRFAPRGARQWGNAMLGELAHVEGSWRALAWALGGAGVMVRQALLALIAPQPKHPGERGGAWLAREATMQKAGWITGGACALAAVLFFLAPVFRQAFRVSLDQWYSIFHVELGAAYQKTETEFSALGRRAEKNHDAEGMAFVAARLHDPADSARLADEAVELDPRLIWIYGVVGARHSDTPDVPSWIVKLEQWDPQNALPYLILAERADIKRVVRGHIGPGPRKPSSAWQRAMAAAFSQTKLDDYMNRLRTLDRAVASRYRLSDFDGVVEGEERGGLPSYVASDSVRYAKSLIESGEALVARGADKDAIEKYMTVARFGQVLDSHPRYPFFSPFVEAYMQLAACQHLAALYKKKGNTQESAFFAGLAAAANQKLDSGRRRERRFYDGRLSGALSMAEWSGFVVEASGIAMLACAGMLLISLLRILARSWPPQRGRWRVDGVATAVGLFGAVGLLVSSATLYVSYRPYAEILRQFLRTGDTSQFAALADFLNFTQAPLGTQFLHVVTLSPHRLVVVGPYAPVRDFVFYFWLIVTVLSFAGLATLATWHLLRCFRPRPLAG